MDPDLNSTAVSRSSETELLILVSQLAVTWVDVDISEPARTIVYDVGGLAIVDLVAEDASGFAYQHRGGPEIGSGDHASLVALIVNSLIVHVHLLITVTRLIYEILVNRKIQVVKIR